MPGVLNRHIEGILQAEGVRQKNKAAILAQYGQIGISQDILQYMCLIRYNLGQPKGSFCENSAWQLGHCP